MNRREEILVEILHGKYEKLGNKINIVVSKKEVANSI
jgi:hypothetical protein